MKLLFVIDSVYSKDGATNKICKKICHALAKENEVSLLENVTPEVLNKAGESGLVSHYKFSFFTERKFYLLINEYRTKKYSIAKIFMLLLLHPFASLCGFSTEVFKHSFVENAFKKEIEKTCKNEHFDAVISMSVPFYTALALAKAKIDTKKVMYTAEPYSTGYLNCTKKCQNDDKLIYKKMDKLFITTLMYEENKTNYLASYLQKCVSLEFPNIKEMEKIQENTLAFSQENGGEIAFDDTKINLVYTGMLYPQIRSPQFLLDLICTLDENITLTMVAGGYDGFPYDFFEKYKQKLGKRLYLVGFLSQEKTNELNAMADVLVNIGNKVENQLPSKVLDYISTGKAILNLCQIENCSSKKILEKYPLKLNVMENENISEEMTQKVNDFCKKSKGETLPYSSVYKEYSDWTLEAVCQKIQKNLQLM